MRRSERTPDQDFYGIRYEGTPMFVQPAETGTRHYRSMTWFCTSNWDKYRETQEALITMHGHQQNGNPIHRTKLIVFLDEVHAPLMDNSMLDNLMFEWGFD